MGTVTVDPGVSITTDAQRTMIEVIKAANFPFPVRVTSASRHEPGSFHHNSSGLAIDFAVGHGMSHDNSLKMRQVAQVLYRHHGHLTEMIHSTPFDDDNGYYIKSGRPVPASYFNEPGPHLNHIHVAATASQARSVLAAIQGSQPKPTPTPSPGGNTVATDEQWIKAAIDDGVRTGQNQTFNNRPIMWLANELLKIQEENAQLRALLNEIKAKVDAPPTPVQEVTHIVVSGDTLNKLATQYSTTVPEIMRLNGLTNDLIVVGQRLRVK